MAAVALLKFQQGVTVGANGQALVGQAGTEAQVRNSSNTDVLSWQIDLLAVPPGSELEPGDAYAFSDNGSTPLATFTPDESLFGCYRWRLRVWSSLNRAGTPDVDIRNFIVRGGVYDVVIPPPMVDPAPLPDPSSGLPGAKPNELNANGQTKGWAGSSDSDGFLNAFLRLIASRHLLSSGSALGQTVAWNGTTYVPTTLNLANPNAVSGLLPVSNLAPGTEGQVVTVVDGTVAWSTPSSSEGGLALPDPEGHYTGEFLRVMSPHGAKAIITKEDDIDHVWVVVPSPQYVAKVDRETLRPVSLHMVNNGTLTWNMEYRNAVFHGDYLFVVMDDNNDGTRSLIKGILEENVFSISEVVEIGTRTVASPDLGFSESLPYYFEGGIVGLGDSVYAVVSEGVVRVDIETMSSTLVAPSVEGAVVTSVAADPDGTNYTDDNPRVWLLSNVLTGGTEELGPLLDRIELNTNTIDDSALLDTPEPHLSAFLGSRVVVGGGFVWVAKSGNTGYSNTQSNTIYKIDPDTLTTVQTATPVTPEARFFLDAYYDTVASGLVLLANNGVAGDPNSTGQLSLLRYSTDLEASPTHHTYDDLGVVFQESFLVRAGGDYWVPLYGAGWSFKISASTFTKTNLLNGVHYTFNDATPPEFGLGYVSAVSNVSGNDITGSGSFENPYASLNHAFQFYSSVAQTYVLGPGDYSGEDPITIDISFEPHTPVPLTFMALGSKSAVRLPELVVNDAQTDITFVRVHVPGITGDGDGVLYFQHSSLDGATAVGLVVEAQDSFVGNLEVGSVVLRGGILFNTTADNIYCTGATVSGSISAGTLCTLRSCDITDLTGVTGNLTLDAATLATNPSVTVSGTLTVLEDSRYVQL